QDRKKDFYVKSFGQTIVRSQRSKTRYANSPLETPFIKELAISVVLPEEYELSGQELYVPLSVSKEDDLHFEFAGFEPGVNSSSRVLNGSLLELLPQGVGSRVLTSKLTLKIQSSALLADINLGPVLTEPVQVFSGVSVNISPSVFSRGLRKFDPSKIFEIE
ncbi:MAG TPA: hypothetical protein V6C96_05455, partial [Vampirovibrionales bacterium]